MATKTRKAATVADLIAAAALGTIDPTTPVVTAAEVSDLIDAARKSAEREAAEHAASVPAPVTLAADPANLPSGTHACGMVGCRHGAAAHANGVHQPDRQVKLACPSCGAVARMTAGAIRKAGGYPTCADGGTFAEAARRTYTRKS